MATVQASTPEERQADHLAALKREQEGLKTRIAGMDATEIGRTRKEARLKDVGEEIKAAEKAA